MAPKRTSHENESRQKSRVTRGQLSVVCMMFPISKEGVIFKRTWDTINTYLGNPYTASSNEEDDFQLMKNGGYLNRFLRNDMTPLTRGWTSFILNNICPVSHTSDRPMTKAYLAYCIQDKMPVHMAAIFSDELYHFVV
ncbi:hypothetical protein TanjilG_27466 [Lupinus angustifolius]|uniref:Putative plant transposon protein domain-containing protein n=1 Tax=Lupinus angustifolius TaxID=3871 RepID=A0A4P1R3H0_LUPAN|nr:hypothetical protein TanjilG_27466 [Lupinus angustifolius]